MKEKKEYTLYFLFIKIWEDAKLIYHDVQQISGCLGASSVDSTVVQRNSTDDGKVLSESHLDWTGGFPSDVFIKQTLSKQYI